jgi:membrane-associated phospholipid phosphatase
MPTDKRRTLISFTAGLALLIGLMIGTGWLITHQLAHDWPFTAEDGVDRTLAADRTTLLNRVSGVLSTLGSTPYAIGLTALGVAVARAVFHRWRESFFLAGAVTVQATVFLMTTLAIDRARPAVAHLDTSPPTSSFPSGHTAAAMALYGGIILLARRRGVGGPAWLLVAVPLAVGGSRLYRGMHHPSDVIAAVVLGALALILVHRTVLAEPFVAADAPAGSRARTRAGMTRS